ncbi:uncharacterized protein HMPREF1541_07489 [Cyphellophora europaea CBS 101466]|uniref:Uncharacterized protein n=1 Tax=Cyphellophora europaea (strain CBS 101466) TaxID=1220924 RepID=W2RN09_CYPE1|nr:uncharacterized protein HMPREF1541_07489 [Cyphellophora europaea CBS 101466]ETN37866.1 hypothetical protein HMPREF1541_07489 [Cyphellophora europaea CBS 101466]
MTAKTPGTFSFVPQRPGGGPDDRRFINTHLSRLAAERRKHAKTAKSVKSPSPSPTRPASTRDGNLSPKQKSSPPRGRTSLSVPPKQTAQRVSPISPLQRSLSLQHVKPDMNDDIAASSEVEAEHQAPLLVSALDNGSHDPFNSTLVVITPEVRKLLAFDREMFFPWASGIEKGDNKHGAFTNKFAKTSLEALEDKCVGYANLARLASSAATITSNPDLHITAMKYKARAYEILRESINERHTGLNEHMLTQIFSLLSIEISGQQHENAALHAGTLQQLLQGQQQGRFDAARMNRRLLCSILWHECLRGSFTLCRPVFDIEKLVDHTAFIATLVATKRQLMAQGFMPSRTTDGFQEAGIGSHLLQRVREFRFLSDVGSALQKAPKLLNEEVMDAFTFRATLTSSKLLEIYNDVYDTIRSSGPDDDLTSAYLETATALAARYWYRVVTSHEAVNVEPTPQSQFYKVFGTQKPVLAHLKEAHEYCKRSGGLQKQPRLWLWILGVGIMAEKADGHFSHDAQQDRSGYFHVAAVAQAKLLDTKDRDAIERILKTFLYSNLLKPSSRYHFEQAINS